MGKKNVVVNFEDAGEIIPKISRIRKINWGIIKKYIEVETPNGNRIIKFSRKEIKDFSEKYETGDEKLNALDRSVNNQIQISIRGFGDQLGFIESYKVHIFEALAKKGLKLKVLKSAICRFSYGEVYVDQKTESTDSRICSSEQIDHAAAIALAKAHQGREDRGRSEHK